MFNQNACINGCNVYICIFMDVMFECRYIWMHECICMYVFIYATTNLSIVCIIYTLLSD